MTDHHRSPEQAATRGLLRAVSDDLGHDVAPEWQKAALAVPRHHFLPDRIWTDQDGRYAPVDRMEDAADWFSAAYALAPVVTQVNDGAEPDGRDDVWPSSSASHPTVVFRMLEGADISPGAKVLHIGTGTGWDTGMISHHIGDADVVSIEVDHALADRARDALKHLGYRPTVVCGDGRLGWGPRAPYDRVLATCSVRRVPPHWIAQTRPGGVIVTPWDNPWICWGLLRLVVDGDGAAVGRYSPHSAFMLMRTQRQDLLIHRDVVKDEHQPEESVTTLPRRAVVSGDAAFAIGHRLGDVWHTWQDNPVDGVADRLWIATTDGTSWAAVDHDGGESDDFTVYQYGPRRLWNEVEEAHHWWVGKGRPGPDRFGLTVGPQGHRAWLDDPAESWPLR
ncbi:methyltransferase domain-containing protein [Streptomyces antimicrobicus]|uniref:Protein-L-isoaspartate O-methyltransferase n=1 Tax=Streptomyces antimicrobicus TaxID=2883108 RepID=A0ABS8B4M6_9ACTN|nr:methyltransferase domain-containing protein [Streptomyces antimicrobicus]MCB5179523.1 methyltransferase [Streptomyces antimicrobicus]